MKTRFDLEQEILGCWSIVEDLELFLERKHEMTEDQINSFISGLVAVYSQRFDRCFDTFSECVKTKVVT